MLNKNDSRTLGVYIARDPDHVYAFAAAPENLPLWAPGLCSAVRRDGAAWIVQTPAGEMRLRFTGSNPFRVLDHWVSPEPGVEIHVPMRVLAHAMPDGTGSEVILTLLRQPGMSDASYAEDIELVQQDLQRLKEVLER